LTSQLLSKELRTSLESAAQRYEMFLAMDQQGDAAVSYLKSRGISLHVAQLYRLGTVDSGSPDHAEYAGWLSIPYLTRSGVVGFKFRKMNEADPRNKYMIPHGQSQRLYNTLAMDLADRTGTLAICEGEIDALTLTALCDIPAVAIPGSDTYKNRPEWRELFRGYQEVLIFQDDDEPGKRLAQQLKADIDTARIIRLPGKDVNDTYMAHGRDGIRRAAGLE
jgi:DNA primase